MGALAEIRELNRLRLLEVLREAGVADRAELTRLTGLSRATVSALVADFIARGAIAEETDAVGTGAPGRPSTRLRLDPRAGAVLGVDFGHRHVRVAVADLAATVLAERRIDLDVHAGAAAALDATAALVRALVMEAGIGRDRILGAGMGIPAPIDRRTGIVQKAAILVEWERINPGDELSRRLGLPVRVANDSDLGALGESRWGAGRDVEDMIFVKLSSGIGAGLILGGSLHTGATGIAGEVGHLCVDPNGVVCRCGNRGCLETVASVDARRGAADDAAWIARAGGLVGDALAALCTAVNPAAIVAGGELSPVLLDTIAARVRETALPPTGELPVRAAVLADRAEVLGAITLALELTEWLRDAGFIALTDAA